MNNLTIKTQQPSSALSNFIDAYWIVENKTDENIKVPIVPDGCVDIILINGELVLVGIMDIVLMKTIVPKDYYFGIRFKPAIIPNLLNIDISEFNNKIVPLHKIDKILYNNLSKIMNLDTVKFEDLNKFFESLFLNVTLDERILSVISDIQLNDGNLSIESLLFKSSLSQKHLERLFISQVGLTPKRFSRIIRFFHTHKYLTKQGISDLCVKVLEKGYYDQSHFNREYKAFTGLKPTSEVMSIFYNTK